MECEALFNKIDSVNEKYLDILEEFCNIESPTDFKEVADKAGDFILNLAKEVIYRPAMVNSARNDELLIIMNEIYKK